MNQYQLIEQLRDDRREDSWIGSLIVLGVIIVGMTILHALGVN